MNRKALMSGSYIEMHGRAMIDQTETKVPSALVSKEPFRVVRGGIVFGARRITSYSTELFG